MKTFHAPFVLAYVLGAPLMACLMADPNIAAAESGLWLDRAPTDIGVPPPEPSTLCIADSCINKVVTRVNWNVTDSSCNSADPSKPYRIWYKDINRWECIPQGYSNYVYSYVCTAAAYGQNCTTYPSSEPGCPNSGCVK